MSKMQTSYLLVCKDNIKKSPFLIFIYGERQYFKVVQKTYFESKYLVYVFPLPLVV